MPWWSWIVIWGVLVLLLAAMLVVFGVVLFRKLMAMFGELEVLAGKAEMLERAERIVDDQHRELAILVGHASTQRRRERVRAAAHERRGDRHDRRLARAKAITSVDASTRRWFDAS